MPGITNVLAKATRHSDNDRRTELIGSTPAHRAGVVELFVRGIRVFSELNFRHGHEAVDRHTHGAADDAFLRQARIEHAISSEALLQTFGDEVHATFASNVFAEDHELRIY